MPGDSVDPSKRAPAEEIFFSALEVSVEERPAFVETACAGSRELRAEVDSLLVGYASGRMPEELDAASALALFEATAAGPEEWRIGSYQVVREIGRGGMGAVYLAERADGAFEHRVALKLIKRGMDSEAILGRFLRERQILARLEHPNIARLLDGGMAQDGRPYLVMEYVSGRALVAYCDEEEIDVEGRLELFTEVCRAVQHAHHNLVVHRDLKPSNVLVTEKGRVKLLDFGIAKLLREGEDAAATALTREGSGVLTPQYAAPEQLLGEPVTTATDVYALGLVLYELLAGELPYAVEGEDAVRAVCETEPVPPSRAVSGSDRAGRRLRRRLRGDLDTIVLKALRKEPERRYASAEALLQDLRRFLDGHPIDARPASLRYRTGRFLRRHWVGATAAALVALAVLGGLLGTTWQAAVAARERDRAQVETGKAQAAQEYLVDIFRAAAPDVARGETVTAQQLLDRGVERIEQELGDQPAVRQEMLRVLSEIERDLGRLERAEELARRALELGRELYGAEHANVALAAHALAYALDEQGKWSEAVELLRTTLEVQRRLLGDGSEPVAETLHRLAHILGNQDEHEEAEALLREALDIRRELFGEVHEKIAASTSNLGLLLYQAGRYTESEMRLREALAIRERLGHDVHPDTAATLNNLALTAQAQGRYVEARELLERAAEIDARTLGSEHPYVAIIYNNIAYLEMMNGDFAGAAERLAGVLEQLRKVLGEGHYYFGVALSYRGMALAELGEIDEGMSLLREADRVIHGTVGGEHQGYWNNRAREALVLSYAGRPEEALRRMEEAVERMRAVRGPDQPEVARWLGNLAMMRLAAGDPKGADAALTEALGIQRRKFSTAHPYTISTLTGLGRVRLAMDMAEEACDLLAEATEMAAEALPQGHWRRADASAALGACLSETGRLEEADPLLRDGYAALLAARRADHPDLAPIRDALRDHELRLTSIEHDG